MKSRADYKYFKQQDTLFIIDLDLGNRSLTNDIENVLREIENLEGSLTGSDIIYRDSEGHWDAVLGWPAAIHFCPLTEQQSQLLRDFTTSNSL